MGAGGLMIPGRMRKPVVIKQRDLFELLYRRIQDLCIIKLLIFFLVLLYLLENKIKK